jgi:hypothetical protein
MKECDGSSDSGVSERVTEKGGSGTGMLPLRVSKDLVCRRRERSCGWGGKFLITVLF